MKIFTIAKYFAKKAQKFAQKYLRNPQINFKRLLNICQSGENFRQIGSHRLKKQFEWKFYFVLKTQRETNESIRAYEMSNYRKKKEQFDSIFDPEIHRGLVARGERRLSLKALQGLIL